MRCHFCKSPATHRCNFKQPDPRIVLPGEISELDIVRDDVALIYRPVKKIVCSEGDYLVLKMAGEKRSTIQRFVNSRLPCLRMEIHECGFPVCENHIREVDEGVFQCMEHWPVLEKVYSAD